MGYCQELANAMERVVDYPNGIILGQTVLAGGSGMSKTLAHIPAKFRLELPVAENMQMGMSIGMSLAGYFPVISVYPRINFLIDAMGILTGELDKICDYSDYCPHVIIRTAIAHDHPMNPGVQHLGDYFETLNAALDNVAVVRLRNADHIREAYETAFNYTDKSVILVEYMSLYDE